MRAGEGSVGQEHVRKRGDGFKLTGGRFRLSMRKKFLTVRMARPVVAVSSLEVSKERLDGALNICSSRN